MANYIRINVDPCKGIFEYEVQFEPEVDSRNFRTKLLNQQQDTLGPARTFDGVTLYLPFELPDRVCFNLVRVFKKFVLLIFIFAAR